MHIKLHTKGIKGSSIVPAGEDPAVLFGVVVEVDDEIVLTAYDVTVSFGEKVVTATLELHPSSIEVVSHDEETWKVFNDERVQPKWEAATARNGMGRALAKHPADG